MIKPIVKENLRNIIINDIIQLIKEGEWNNGEKIPTEMELAQSYNVSRNIIRESLKILEMFGILESKVSKGTFLTENAVENILKMVFYNELKNNKSFDKLFEIRLIIEPHLAYLASTRRTDQDVEILEKYIKNTSEEINKSSITSDHFELHRYIAEMSGNSILEKLLVSIYDQIRASSYFNLMNQEGEDSLGQHVNLARAIIDQKSKTAQELMYRHLKKRLTILSEETFENVNFF